MGIVRCSSRWWRARDWARLARSNYAVSLHSVHCHSAILGVFAWHSFSWSARSPRVRYVKYNYEPCICKCPNGRCKLGACMQSTGSGAWGRLVICCGPRLMLCLYMLHVTVSMHASLQSPRTLCLGAALGPDWATGYPFAVLSLCASASDCRASLCLVKKPTFSPYPIRACLLRALNSTKEY